VLLAVPHALRAARRRGQGYRLPRGLCLRLRRQRERHGRAGAWSTLAEQVGEHSAGASAHVLPGRDPAEVEQQLGMHALDVLPGTFAAYRPLNWMTVCRLACEVEYAR